MSYYLQRAVARTTDRQTERGVIMDGHKSGTLYLYYTNFLQTL